MNISSSMLINSLSKLTYKIAIMQNNEVIYSNHNDKNILNMNHLIDSYFRGNYNALEAIDGYHSIVMKNNDASLKSIFLKQVMDTKIKTTLIEIRYLEEDNLTLYVHEDISEYCLDQSKVNKSLRANELIMEINDIIDNSNDLLSMYTIILSKIHTVIPAVRRSCILKLNENRELFIFASYGYDQDFIDSMKVPFEKSYAFLNLKDDFTQSVIINDIQTNYTHIHPNVTKKQYGFLHESNISTPLLQNGALHSILSIDSDLNRVFDNEDLSLLNFIKKQVEKAITRFENLQVIRDESQKDVLTGLFNRRYIEHAFNSYADKSNLLGKSFCMVIFDLDHLKITNDTFGHIAGDILIKNFASFVGANIRPSDVAARIGGDEFVVLFFDVDKDKLYRKILKWKATLGNLAIQFEDNDLRLEFGFGISAYNLDGSNYEELLRKADNELYLYKHSRIKQSN